MLKKIFIPGCLAVIMYSCIKPHACECEYVYTTPVQKSHVLVYASKSNKDEACSKQNKDTSVVCKVKE